MNPVNSFDLVNGGQAAAQVFQNPVLLAETVLDSLSIPETLNARKVCKDWGPACHLRIRDILCRKLGEKLDNYLKHVGITLNQYLLARDIDHLKPSIKNLFLHLIPIKVDVSIEECRQIVDFDKINAESIEQDIRTHITDSKYWPKYLSDLARRLGYTANCDLQELVDEQTCSEKSELEREEDLNQMFEAYLPIVSSIEEFIKRIGDTPYFSLYRVNRLSKKEKKLDFQGLCIWAQGHYNDDWLHADDHIRNCVSFHFPVTLFGFKPEDLLGEAAVGIEEEDFKGDRFLSLERIIDDSFCPWGWSSDTKEGFCAPVDGKLYEFNVCPKGEFNGPGNYFSHESGTEDGPWVYEPEEEGYRRVETQRWWDFVFMHPYIAEDALIPDSSEDSLSLHTLEEEPISDSWEYPLTPYSSEGELILEDELNDTKIQ